MNLDLCANGINNNEDVALHYGHHSIRREYQVSVNTLNYTFYFFSEYCFPLHVYIFYVYRLCFGNFFFFPRQEKRYTHPTDVDYTIVV